MVHGNYVGVHYIIYLSRPIDQYDDLLPICISARKMLSFYKNDPTKIRVFGYEKFNTRFQKSVESQKITKAILELSYSHIDMSKKKEYPELFLYNDVYVYSEKIKGKNVIVVSKETYLEMEERLDFLLSKLKNDELSIEDECGELSNLKKELTIQRIIYDTEYLQKVIDIEKNVIDEIELTAEQKEMIEIIPTHPKLEGLIQKIGMEITTGSY